ncbi:hypothetical protein Q757_08360, partial [Oenococcus alcoholitolerans]
TSDKFIRQSSQRVVSQLNDSWNRLKMAFGGDGQGIELPKFPTIDDSAASNKGSKGSNSTDDNRISDPNATPTESIVAGVHLDNVYYYHFSQNLPQAARQIFQQAVDQYNSTGIVHLILGTPTGQHNLITFSSYTKNEGSALSQGTIELGRGGPEIIQQYGYQTHSFNHGIASLNLAYRQSLSLPVAVHELGHALGLDHSSDRDSVMFPIDQGKSRLSTGDIDGLKNIYDRT